MKHKECENCGKNRWKTKVKGSHWQCHSCKLERIIQLNKK